MKIKDELNNFLDQHGDFTGFVISVVRKDGQVTVHRSCNLFELSMMSATISAVLNLYLTPREGLKPTEPPESNVQSIKKT